MVDALQVRDDGGGQVPRLCPERQERGQHGAAWRRLQRLHKGYLLEQRREPQGLQRGGARNEILERADPRVEIVLDAGVQVIPVPVDQDAHRTEPGDAKTCPPVGPEGSACERDGGAKIPRPAEQSDGFVAHALPVRIRGTTKRLLGPLHQACGRLTKVRPCRPLGVYVQGELVEIQSDLVR